MSASERYGFDPSQWATAIQELDAAFAGAWAPRLKGMVKATRTFAYFGGPALQDDGTLDWYLDGTIICPDNALSLVQREPLTGTVSVAATLAPGNVPMAIVRCVSGNLTRFVDARDAVLGRGARYLEDLLDVDFYGLEDGQSMRYDAASGLWLNADIAFGLDVEDEGGVVVAGASALVFTGTGKSVSDVAGKPTVNIPGPVDDPGELLKLNPHRLAVVYSSTGSTNVLTFGHIGIPAGFGNLSSRSPGTASFQDSKFAVTRQNAGSANQSAGWGVNAANQLFWRGNAAGRGGFTALLRFSYDVFQASHRAFMGMTAAGAGAHPGLGAEPSTFVNIIGIGFDSTDTNFQLLHNDGSGAATKVDTGVAPAAGVMYEVVLIQSPNGGNCEVRLYSADSDGSTLLYSGTVSTNLPATTAYLSPVVIDNTAAASTQSTLCMNGWTFDTL